MTTLTAMQQTIEKIAELVRTELRIAQRYGVVLTTDQAVDTVVSDLIRDGRDASARRGYWQREITTERMEGVLWMAAVAGDIRDNTFRPSTGPAGDHLRKLLS